MRILFKSRYTLFSMGFAGIFWIIESIFHAKVLQNGPFTIMPYDADDLWMRIIICLLIVGYGFFIQRKINTEIDMQKETVEVYQAMINAQNHILNNFLQKMYIFKLEADNSKDFDQEILNMYYEIINETKQTIRGLEDIEIPTRLEIENRLLPKNNKI